MASVSNAEAKRVTERSEDAKDALASKICIALGLMMTSVTMCVPTRAPMVLSIKKGDAAATAKAMGLMSTMAAVIELVINPVLGKLSDEHGRKPFMTFTPLVSAFLHTLVAAMPGNLAMQFVDRMISGSMIFGFMAPLNASLADLFAKNPQKLGAMMAKAGSLMGAGAALGPFIGAKLGGARSFFISALAFVGTSFYVQTLMEETLTEDRKKAFKWSDINPLLFLKLYNKKTLAWLSSSSALASFGDYVNVYDINNLFMIKVLGYGQSQIGTFATLVGVTQILGGQISSKLIKATSLKLATVFGNIWWAVGMLMMGSARTTPQAFAALLIWTLGHQRATGTNSYVQKYAAKEDMGRAEIIAAQGNLSAYLKVLAPLLYSNLFALGTSNGHNMPGLPYFLISALTVLSQLAFLKAAPED